MPTWTYGTHKELYPSRCVILVRGELVKKLVVRKVGAVGVKMVLMCYRRQPMVETCSLTSSLLALCL